MSTFINWSTEQLEAYRDCLKQLNRAWRDSIQGVPQKVRNELDDVNHELWIREMTTEGVEVCAQCGQASCGDLTPGDDGELVCPVCKEFSPA